MIKIRTLIFLLSASLLFSCTKRDINYPILKFKEGKFKIVQFTDIHFQYNSYRSDSALSLMKTVIADENPDLVILTGDIVCSKDTRSAWLALTSVLVDAEIPWAVTFGNHDQEYELTKDEIMETISGLPYNMTKSGPVDVSGTGNYILEIQSPASTQTEAILYCLDSHSSFHPETNTGSYEWIDFSQIAWYRKQSSNYTLQNGGKPLPALAFFHIPLPEYKDVVDLETTIGLSEETVCSPDLNSGMYTAMLECGDVMGTFVGHDHDNNYIGCLRKICLAYGNATGRQCYGKIGRGARVIVLYEGERKFDTWILKNYECDRDQDLWFPTVDKSPQYFITYQDSLLKPMSKVPDNK